MKSESTKKQRDEATDPTTPDAPTSDLGAGVKEFSLTSKKTGVSGTFQYDFGEGLNGMVKRFGEAVVAATALQQFVIKAQGLCRRILDNGGTVEAAATKLASWVPGAPTMRKAKDPVGDLANAYPDMTPEEQEKVRAQLAAMIKNTAK